MAKRRWKTDEERLAQNAKNRERNARWRDAHREEYRAAKLADYYRNHDVNKERARARYHANPEADLARRLMRKFGLTPEQRAEIFEFQGSRCACCATDDPGCVMGWTVDHDHDTDTIRGVLCWPCNVVLGQVGDTATEIAARCALFLHYVAQTGGKVAPEVAAVLRDVLGE